MRGRRSRVNLGAMLSHTQLTVGKRDVLYSMILHLNSCFRPVLKGACVVAQHGGGQGSSPQLEQVAVRVGRVGVEGGGGGGGQRSPISSPPHHPQGLRRHVGRATQPALQDRGVETSNQALNIGMWSPEFWSLGTLWGQRGKAAGQLAQDEEEQSPKTWKGRQSPRAME